MRIYKFYLLTYYLLTPLKIKFHGGADKYTNNQLKGHVFYGLYAANVGKLEFRQQTVTNHCSCLKMRVQGHDSVMLQQSAWWNLAPPATELMDRHIYHTLVLEISVG